MGNLLSVLTIGKERRNDFIGERKVISILSLDD
jgi:hypothetical protein